ncbi:MAG: DUF2162 domain-containing protein [Synergistaceae bacterium]|jgi:predicted transporter|nr:DUF2162 domain-containing protein [Synergistaceae bacterium]
MELKSLFLGMIISMAAFSVKAGIGTGYMLSKRPRGRKIPAALAVLASYGALFAAVAAIAARVNVLAQYDFFRTLLSGGVAIHWGFAVFILAWGVFLLKRIPGEAGKECCSKRADRAWLALVVPCPVCAAAVLMSASALVLYFPDDAWLSVAGLYAAFAAIASVSAAAVLLAPSSRSGAPEESLGTAMILTAAYFIVSALVMPQFAEIGRIYRMALYSGEARAADASSSRWALAATLAMLALGFAFAKARSKKIYRKKLY